MATKGWLRCERAGSRELKSCEGAGDALAASIEPLIAARARIVNKLF